MHLNHIMYEMDKFKHVCEQYTSRRVDVIYIHRRHHNLSKMFGIYSRFF